MKYVIKLLMGAAKPLPTFILFVLKRVAAAFLTKRVVIWVLAEAAKTSNWEWDDAAVRLLVAADSGTDEEVQRSLQSLITAVKLDYVNAQLKADIEPIDLGE